jgi:hypothetical protein
MDWKLPGGLEKQSVEDPVIARSHRCSRVSGKVHTLHHDLYEVEPRQGEGDRGEKPVAEGGHPSFD